MSQLGRRIKKARLRRGWTQSLLAEESGVTQPLVSRLESGKQPDVTTEVAKRLAVALGISIDWLVDTWGGLDDEQTPARMMKDSYIEAQNIGDSDV
jgi:transcriptional regulator with XRE-family HTH domain